MSGLSLDELKRHCSAVGFSDDDQLIQDLQDLAEAFVKGYTRKDLDALYPGAWPKQCVGAVKMLVAYWYKNREAVAEGVGSEVPFGVRDMLADQRDLS